MARSKDLACPARSRGADIRWPVAGDGRRSFASFGARVGAVRGSHSTGCRERFYALQSGQATSVLAPVAAPGTAQWGLHGLVT
jgi:hypothetical protein